MTELERNPQQLTDDEDRISSPRLSIRRRRRDFHAEGPRIYAQAGDKEQAAVAEDLPARRSRRLACLALVLSSAIVYHLVHVDDVDALPTNAHLDRFPASALTNGPELAASAARPAPTSLDEALALFTGDVDASHHPRDPPSMSRVVWSTWKTSVIPPNYRPNWDAMEASNPEYDFRLVNDTEADVFMRRHFQGPTYRAYRSINPSLGAMRADLWRYCVLYVYGGVYLDVDSFIGTPLRLWVGDGGGGGEALLGTEGNAWDNARTNCDDFWSMLLGDELPDEVPGGHTFIQWMLVFPIPGHPILWEAIRLVTEHVNAWNDTDGTRNVASALKVLCLSGPPVFSAAVRNVLRLAGGNWTKLRARMEDTDFGGKAKYRGPGWVSLKTVEGHYLKMKPLPVKVAAL